MNSKSGAKFPLSAITVLAVAVCLVYAFVLWQGVIQKSLETKPVACSIGVTNACQVGTYCRAIPALQSTQGSDNPTGTPTPNGLCAPYVYKALDAAKSTSGN